VRVVVVLVSALAVALLGAPTASAAPPAAHPGYTIVAPQLTPLVAGGKPTRVLTGVLDAAGYAVEVPAHWNGQLVMWAHGFRGNGAELTVDAPSYGLRQRFVDQGYAWAASSYDRNGYDVASGVRSTHELATAQALAAVRAYPPGPDYGTVALPAIYAGLGLAPNNPAVTTPKAQQLRAETVLDSGGVRPGADASFSYWKDFLLSLAVPGNAPTPVTGVALNPGVVATNVGHDYAPDAPVNPDVTVQRVRPADPAARNSRALTPVAQVAGKPRVPVLTLHGVGDLFVPFSMEQIYAGEVADAGRSDLLVQRAIRTTGHCEFSDAEAGKAWDDLVAWTDGGKRPAGDDVDATSGPTFGCRFSDPAAYAAAGPPSQTDTRRLFAPCPATG
jgi:fermentation-respiration switch protein FrsA (DUF1100 family)